MKKKDEHWDAIVIGGGPAGSAAATFLAREKVRTVVLERSVFPRFHIGESLLAATLPILDRLGVHDAVKARAIRKGGGKWVYGESPLRSNFSHSSPRTGFYGHDHAYMVERAQFDALLLENAQAEGVEVRHQVSVVEVIRNTDNEGRVVGVVAKDDSGEVRELYAPIIFDCSGQQSFLSKQLGLRRSRGGKRMAVFAHYQTKVLDEDSKEGWFIGQMFYNGWSWIIPLSEELVSIGIVLDAEEFKRVSKSPEEILDYALREHEFLRNSLTPNPIRSGSVRTASDVGHSSTRFFGEGFILVGDAAFFVDPCYSSGVHMALYSAEQSVRAYQESRRLGNDTPLMDYQRGLRRHENNVFNMVDSFYIASRNSLVRKFVVWGFNFGFGEQDFIDFVCGDFGRNGARVAGLRYSSMLLESLTRRFFRASPFEHP